MDKEGLGVWLQQVLEDGTKVNAGFKNSFGFRYETLEVRFVSWTV